VTFLSNLLGRRDREGARPLYDAAVAAARQPFWYREGGVPDTIDGRFDMLSAVLALILLRLEAAGEAEEARGQSVRLTETFVDDMDATMRQIGIGDVVVGKKMGKLMGALGGRTGAFRRALAGDEPFETAVRRNVYRDAPASEDGLERVADRLRRFHDALAAVPLESVLAGELPTP